MTDWADVEALALYRLVTQLWQFKENLYSPSLLWAYISAVERLFHKVRQLEENVDNLSPSLPLEASISATMSRLSLIKGKGSMGTCRVPPCASICVTVGMIGKVHLPWSWMYIPEMQIV